MYILSISYVLYKYFKSIAIRSRELVQPQCLIYQGALLILLKGDAHESVRRYVQGMQER